MPALTIKVGSKNPAKLDAVREILQEYSHLKDAVVEGADAVSDVSDQPKTLEETIRGAMNRAKSVFNNCTYSIGLESGVMPVPYTKSGYLELTACVIHDGNENYIGLSSAWEFPNKELMRLVIEEGLDLTQASNKLGLTTNPELGKAEGIVGIVTKGRLDRKGYTKQALRMALIHIDNP